jgi:hypothetical protein
MQLRTTRTAVLFALLAAPAFADVLTSTTSGAGWQSWTTATLNHDGTPFWDGQSIDKPSVNVGDCFANPTCTLLNRPGAIDYWGMASGTYDPSVYLTKSVPSSNAALKIEIAGNKNLNQFGWYDTTLPGQYLTNLLFDGPQTTGASAIFTPTATYGFWFKGAAGHVYYTQSGLSTWGDDKNKQHFAIFAGDLTPGRELYWIGMEDVLLANGDRDYQDMIVQVSAIPVPDGGLTLSFLGAAMIAFETFRRKLRA